MKFQPEFLFALIMVLFIGSDAVAKLQSDLMPKVKAGDVVSVSFNETTYKAIYKNAFKKLTKGENRYVQSVCGKTKASRTRINNGKIAHQKQFPWIIYLSDGKTYCTGVLISPRHVLTARHCVVYRDESQCSFKNLTTVEYGGTCLYKGADCPMGNMKMATVGGFTIPQDNAVCKKTTDLAVIFLKKKVKFNDYVKPICMSSRIHPSSLVQLKDLGFGEKRSSVMSSNLRYMDSKIFGYNWPLVITQGIDNGNNTASICSGDSGGPLQGTINGSKRTYLAGIHSQAMPCSIHGFGLTLLAFVGNPSSGKSEVRRAYVQMATKSNKNAAEQIDANTVRVHGYQVEVLSVGSVVEFARIPRMNRCNHLDAIVVFYDVESLEQFEGVHHAWVPAIRRLFPHTPFIVCGTGIEARINKEERKLALKTRLNEILGHPMSGTLSPRRKAFGIKSTMTTYDTKKYTSTASFSRIITSEMGHCLAREMGAAAFKEVSSKTYENVAELMDTVMDVILESELIKLSLTRHHVGRPKPDETCATM